MLAMAATLWWLFKKKDGEIVIGIGNLRSMGLWIVAGGFLAGLRRADIRVKT